MEYNLIVKDFGKIKEANIHVSPLTLFVGDNNSGKSYLLSLLWALRSVKAAVLFDDVLQIEHEAFYDIKDRLCTGYENALLNEDYPITLPTQQLISILNICLDRNKDKFVSSIFNDSQVHIGTLQIESNAPDLTITLLKQDDAPNHISYKKSWMVSGNKRSKEDFAFSTIQHMLRQIISDASWNSMFYLPAVRTGFMLSKNVINKVARSTAFDNITMEDSATSNIPFTKPILEFLNTLEDLPIIKQTKEKYSSYAVWIENTMTKGQITQSNNPSREIRYIPMGAKDSISLRTSSAVVTELAPLVLLLKHQSHLRTLCYEEPEMCLHPQLQAQMGMLLVRLVNSGVNVIATTHSDIIIQHVNNMCRLSNVAERKDLMEKFDLIDDDLIDTSRVAVYQLKDCGDYSTVGEIRPGKNGFEVPTFYDALMDILEQTTDIEDAVTEQEA